MGGNAIVDDSQSLEFGSDAVNGGYLLIGLLPNLRTEDIDESCLWLGLIDICIHSAINPIQPRINQQSINVVILTNVQVFGCDMRKEYPATLFRFPLRTPAQAAKSEISKQVR